MKKLLPLFLLPLLSCDPRSAEEIAYDTARELYVSPYQGTWICHYTGDETGVFTLEIDKKGYVTRITRTSQNFYEEGIGGFVSSQGGLSQTYSGASKFAIYGSVFLKKGTWKMGNLSGEWTAVKQ